MSVDNLRVNLLDKFDTDRLFLILGKYNPKPFRVVLTQVRRKKNFEGDIPKKLAAMANITRSGLDMAN